MRRLLAALYLTAALAAGQNGTVFQKLFDAVSTAQASSAVKNQGQLVHVLTVLYPTAVADVSSFTIRLEASYDNTTFVPIGDDVTAATYNGTLAYSITRANGAFPYIRGRIVSAHASLPVTVHYTGSAQPIGQFRLVGTRYVAASTNSPDTLATVTYSATPTFDFGAGNAQKLTLTGNVTSSSITGLAAGMQIAFILCQDATGSRTFVWPTAVKGGMTIGSTASKCSAQQFISDGTSLYAISPGVINQ